MPETGNWELATRSAQYNHPALMDLISSRQNAIVKRFRQLAAGDPTGEWMLLDGEHLVSEALGSGLRIDIAAFVERLANGPMAGIVDALERRGARVVAVTDQVLGAMSPVRQPSGVVAIAKRPSAALDQVLHTRHSLVLILGDVQDPGNVGAIIRAAEGCGATGIVITTGAADPFSWKALRGGMGSTFRLPIASGQSLDAAVEHARAAGLRVIATTARTGTPLPDSDLRPGCAILLGGEGPGLPAAIVDAADERVTIPMQAPVESLNVAIAAALVLYEAARQRATAVPVERSTNVAL
jgi:TrmH family RNA methyltransferase